MVVSVLKNVYTDNLFKTYLELWETKSEFIHEPQKQNFNDNDGIIKVEAPVHHHDVLLYDKEYKINDKKTWLVKRPEFNPPKKLTIGKRRMFSKMLLLIECMYHKREKTFKGCTLVNIPITRGSYIEKFGGMHNIARMIKMSNSIGLTCVVDSDYRYISEKTIMKHYMKDRTFARQLGWNYNMELELLAYCKLNHIEVWNPDDNKKPVNIKVSKKIKDSIRINSSLNIKKEGFISRTKYTQFVKNECYKVYSQAEENKNIIKEINKYYKQNDMNEAVFLHVDFNVHWKNSQTIGKIGYRVTSDFCNIPKQSNTHTKYCRKDFLKDNHLQGSHYDVHSSIPNIMYLLHTGKWIGEDMYKMIFDSMKRNVSYEQITWNDNTRNLFKKMFMKINFGHSKEDSVKNIIRAVTLTKTIKQMESKKYLMEMDSNYLHHLEEEAKQELTQFATDFYNAVIDVLGFTSSSEIFLHESSVYLRALKIFNLEYNLNAVLLYDAFYFINEETPSEGFIFATIKRAAEEYYDEYIKNQSLKSYVNSNNIKKLTAIIKDNESIINNKSFKLSDFLIDIQSIPYLSEIKLHVFDYELSLINKNNYWKLSNKSLNLINKLKTEQSSNTYSSLQILEIFDFIDGKLRGKTYSYLRELAERALKITKLIK